MLQKDLYDGAEYLEGLQWLVLLLTYPFLLLQLSPVWKEAAQDLEMYSSCAETLFAEYVYNWSNY